jgi:sugar phosphate isomerase/epimerase
LLGLKCSTSDSQFYDRLSHNPDVIEFFLIEEDLFGNNRINLENKIKIAQDKGILVYLHHPMIFQNMWLNIIDDNPTLSSYYDVSTHILIDICLTYDIYCVIHPHYGVVDGYEKIDFRNPDNIKKAKERIIHFQKLSNNRILWENSVIGFFSFENPNFINDFVIDLNLPICFDISHAFISFRGDNQKLKLAIDALQPHTRYYHVVDSMGLEHDSLQLGEGKTDWSQLVPYLNEFPYIFEIDIKNLDNCVEMINSYNYLETLKKDLI